MKIQFLRCITWKVRVDIFRAVYFLINISLCYLAFLLEPNGAVSLANKPKGGHSGSHGMT